MTTFNDKDRRYLHYHTFWLVILFILIVSVVVLCGMIYEQRKPSQFQRSYRTHVLAVSGMPAGVLDVTVDFNNTSYEANNNVRQIVDEHVAEQWINMSLQDNLRLLYYTVSQHATRCVVKFTQDDTGEYVLFTA